MPQINLRSVANDQHVLAGAVTGRNVLARLLAETATEPDAPELVYLDLKGVTVATASFLRESIVAFRDIVRGRRSKYYPVVTNANEVVRDELLALLQPRGDVLMTCLLHADGSVSDAKPLGELDPKQQLTFTLVCKHGETDASELMRGYGAIENLKHATAWNNRLTSLVALGLVVELKQGRARRYRALFKDVE